MKTLFKAHFYIGPLVVLLVINTFVAISSAISFSISPFLLTETCGMSIFLFGCLEGICECLANAMKLVSGGFIDRFRNKKRVLSVGLFLAVLSRPFLYFGRNISSIFISKFLERLSNGIIAPSRDALTTEISPKAYLSQIYSLMVGSKTFGCVIGSFSLSFLSLLAPSLFQGNYSFFIVLSSMFSIVALILALVFLKDFSVEKASDELLASFQFKDILHLGQGYWSLLLCVFFFMLGRFNDGLLIVYLKKVGSPQAFYLSTIGIYNFVSMLIVYPVGWLLDNDKKQWGLFVPIVSLFVFNVCFLNPNCLWMLFLGVALWGVQRASSQVVFVSMIAKMVPLSHLGTALGLYYLVAGVMGFIAAGIASSLADYSFPLIFVLSMSCSILAYFFLPKVSCDASPASGMFVDCGKH